MLTRARILDLFAELDGELCAEALKGDVFVVGGAAMVVGYDARPATRDIDAIWRPSAEVRAAAARIAARYEDLEPDWLNDGVKGFLPGDDQGPPRVIYEGECLTVSVGSAEYLLATKLLASRVGRDEDDIGLLLDECGVTSVEGAAALLERYYPGGPSRPECASWWRSSSRAPTLVQADSAERGPPLRLDLGPKRRRGLRHGSP